MTPDELRKHLTKKFPDVGFGQLAPVESISTGSLLLDVASGVGGFPKGRMIELFGPPSSSKTTLALTCVARLQQSGGLACYIDVEHAIDPTYAEALGVNMTDLVLCQPDTGEEAFDVAIEMAEAGVGLVVIDSIAALVPKAELEGEMEDQQMGLQARLIGKGCRKIKGILAEKGGVLLGINQTRQKLGGYGNPITTPGGEAFKFFSSMRVRLSRSGGINGKNGEESLGNVVKATFDKNKVGRPFTSAEFEVVFGKGIDSAGEMLEILEAEGVVKRGGAWYDFGSERVQGRDAAKEVAAKLYGLRGRT